MLSDSCRWTPSLNDDLSSKRRFRAGCFCRLSTASSTKQKVSEPGAPRGFRALVLEESNDSEPEAPERLRERSGRSRNGFGKIPGDLGTAPGALREASEWLLECFRRSGRASGAFWEPPGPLGRLRDDSGSAPSKDIRASFRKRTKKSAQSKKLFDPTQLKSAGFRSAGSVHVAHGFTLSKNQEPSRNIEKIEVGAT